MKIKGSRVLKSTLTKSQQPNLMLITHISNSFKPILGMFYFCFNAQDWELEMVMSFFEQLYSTRVRHGEVDRVVWILSKRRNFEVKTFYKALVCHEMASFPWKGIWRVKAPKRVAFFVWTAALGKILTHDNLRRRGIVVVEWCVMCKKHGESVDHLLLHCDVA
jgi:hypothetical protein